MTLRELWEVAPQNFIYVIGGKDASEYVGQKGLEDITRKEYNGEKYGRSAEVERIIARSISIHDHVIEVVLK